LESSLPAAAAGIRSILGEFSLGIDDIWSHPRGFLTRNILG
jgi:hypothetical protein